MNKTMPEKLPKVTVITVVLNGKNEIEKTIKSVLGQDYKDLEYIVIDGGSTDGTLGIIKNYEGSISSWISEKDKGLYDAMNKGIDIAGGDYVNFMNSGDEFYSSKSIKKAMSNIDDADIVYGPVEVRYGGFSKIRRPGGLGSLWKGMVFCHQSCFFKGDLLKKKYFDTRYRIAADYDIVCNAYAKGLKFLLTQFPVAAISVAGVSDISRVKVVDEYSRISKKYFSVRCSGLFFFASAMYYRIAPAIKKVIPAELIKAIIKMKRA